MSSFAETYRKLDLLDQCTKDLPATEGALPHIWKLEEQIRPEFAGYIQMWEQGLISCKELLNQLQFVMELPRS